MDVAPATFWCFFPPGWRTPTSTGHAARGPRDGFFKRVQDSEARRELLKVYFSDPNSDEERSESEPKACRPESEHALGMLLVSRTARKNGVITPKCWVMRPCLKGLGSFCLDGRTLTFGQLVGFPLLPPKVKLFSRRVVMETPGIGVRLCPSNASCRGLVAASWAGEWCAIAHFDEDSSYHCHLRMAFGE